MDIRKTALMLALYLFLEACGGGGHGSKDCRFNEAWINGHCGSLEFPIEIPVSGGFWLGTLTFDSGPVTEEYVGLVSEDGQFRFFSADNPIQFSGVQSTTAGVVSGSGFAVAEPGAPVWQDGSTATTLTTDAMLTEQVSFAGTWAAASGDTGSFDFVYDPEYERPSSLAQLEGVWSGFDELGNPNASFTIDGLGQFTGQNSFGCTSSGNFLILDARYNIYQVESTITGCAIAAQYSGMAAMGDIDNPNDAIILAIDSGERPILLGIQK